MSKLFFQLKIENKHLPSDEAVIANFFICFSDRGFCELYGKKKDSNQNIELRFEVSKNLADLFENIFGKTNESLRLKYSYVVVSDSLAFHSKSLKDKLVELADLKPFADENDIDFSDIYEHLFTMHFAKSPTASFRL